MREVAEETGLQVVAIETHINAFDYEEEFGIRTRQFNFAVKVQELVAVRLSSEHDAAEWFAANQTSDPRLDDQMRDLLTDYLSKVRTGNAR
jgi:8-oxo-dGTP pyrophosphatase MutT (NUDIX family)